MSWRGDDLLISVGNTGATVNGTHIMDDDDVSLLEDGHNFTEMINGENEELSEKQCGMINLLHNRMQPFFEQLVHTVPADNDFCSHDTCRRYLVAREWNFFGAETQLRSTLAWRMDKNPASLMKFWQSPAFNNPYSLNLRCVGFDLLGRPIIYTCFSQVHERHDINASMIHLTLCLEACMQMLRKRSSRGMNKTAESRQWIWVVDFGCPRFAFRKNPLMSSMTARLMQHYPEMLNSIVAVNFPLIYRALWRISMPYVNERVKDKIIILNEDDDMKKTLRSKLGPEATDWLSSEIKSNRSRCFDWKRKNYKKYWAKPATKGDHDSRGMSSYVNSDYYILTPGEASERLYQDKGTM
mmetsp:Transcript_11997/g.14674  ORF Transcript_11997/g.14674 Transcript_11997/m.14674 type:complete len:354 (-) Transcript_11997:457-1518(-)